jgi:tellurite methyltransferase
MDALIEKWDRIYHESGQELYSTAQVLTENDFLLPPKGTALDMACGLGNNAVFLAEQGLRVTAWDISSVAIDKLKTYAVREGLKINARQRKITANSFNECSYDVIIVSRFLDRSLSGAIIGALKPDGLLFYQTFTREKTSLKPPHNPDYLLAENELLKMFSPLRVIYYRENAFIGEQSQGLRDEAQFIGQKRK